MKQPEPEPELNDEEYVEYMIEREKELQDLLTPPEGEKEVDA